MYFKKQLYFIGFLLIVIGFVTYKQEVVEQKKNTIQLVSIKVKNIYCDSRSTGNNSFIQFDYNDKNYKQYLSQNRCNSLTTSDSVELAYHALTDHFYWPEYFEENYFQKINIFLVVLLCLALIPYKRILT